MRQRARLAILVLATAAATARPASAAGPPRGPHPRIWLGPPTLAALKHQAASSSSWATAAIERCRQVVKKPGSIQTSGYQGDNWAFAASSCALAWQLTGDATLARAGVTLWRALVEDVERLGDKKACVAGTPPANWNASIRRDTGYAIRFVGPHAALAYDWLHDAPGADEALRRESRACFASWIDWYTRSGYLNAKPGANYHAGFVLAKTLTAIAAAGEDAWGDRAWSEVTADLFGSQIVGQGLAGADPAAGVPPGALVGGDWPEGWQYGPLSVIEYALAARAVEEQGVKLPAVDRWAGEVTLRALHATTPAGDEIFAGGDTEMKGFVLRQEGAGLMATIAGPGSDEAAAWADALWRRVPKSSGSQVFGALAEARGIAPRSYLDRPRPLWYLARGTRNVYARSAWDASAFWGVFTSAPRLVPDHQHPDASNFVFSRGRDHLIVDPSPYGSRSSLTSNAVTCDSAVVGPDYRPSQTPWSRADLTFARATQTGVVAARGDFRQAFHFADSASDIPFAERDWVFLPEGEIVAIDRIDTGDRGRRAYLRFRTPAHLTLGKNRRTATGTVGSSTVAIHTVTASGGAPVVRTPIVGECTGATFGACAAARVPVEEYALELPGPNAFAVHAIDGLNHGERAAEVGAVIGDVLGVTIKRAGRESVVVSSARIGPGHAAAMTYAAPGALPARHVVFDAPANEAGRSAVRATAGKGSCKIAISAAPAGEAGFAGRPLVLVVGKAAAGCAVTEEPDAPSATLP